MACSIFWSVHLVVGDGVVLLAGREGVAGRERRGEGVAGRERRGVAGGEGVVLLAGREGAVGRERRGVAGGEGVALLDHREVVGVEKIWWSGVAVDCGGECGSRKYD